MSFRLVPKSVTLNDLECNVNIYIAQNRKISSDALNGVMAVILRIPANSGSFRGALRKRSRSLSHLLMSSCSWMSTDGQRTIRRRNIAENYNRLSIGCTSVTDRQKTDGRATAYSEREREREFTFTKTLYATTACAQNEVSFYLPLTYFSSLRLGVCTFVYIRGVSW